MTMVSSGPISIGGSATTGGLNQSINIELGRSATATSSLNETALRNLAGVASGAISLSNFYGKSNAFAFTISTNQSNVSLFNSAVAAGWNQSSALICTIAAGVYISAPVGTPSGQALGITGTFPNGVTLINNGFILGTGGNGGQTSGGIGSTGAAIVVNANCTIQNNAGGVIAGGGGGGAGYGFVSPSVIYAGGGGGAGGGNGAAAAVGASVFSGGSGGSVGNAGSSGAGVGNPIRSGAGGGRVFSGVQGGAGATAAANAVGGGNGGGGGGVIRSNGSSCGPGLFTVTYYAGGGGGGWGAAGGSSVSRVVCTSGLSVAGGAGGSINAVGNNGVVPFSTVQFAGGVGGRAIRLNATATVTNNGAIYGAISA